MSSLSSILSSERFNGVFYSTSNQCKVQTNDAKMRMSSFIFLPGTPEYFIAFNVQCGAFHLFFPPGLHRFSKRRSGTHSAKVSIATETLQWPLWREVVVYPVKCTVGGRGDYFRRRLLLLMPISVPEHVGYRQLPGTALLLQI